MIEVLKSFDHFLKNKNLEFSATIIGGAALIILGVINRATKDIDCLDPQIPETICRASVEFAKKYRGEGAPLKTNWFNNGPQSLKKELPQGWQKQTIPLYAGTNLHLETLGRLDLLRSKLFAYCDRQQDLQDCIALKPKLGELKRCYLWLTKRDFNPLWPQHVLTSLIYLSRELGYEFKP